MSNAKSNNKNQQRKPNRGDGGKNSGGGSGGSGNAGNNGGGGRGSNDKGRANNNRRRKGPRKKKIDPKVFWGDSELLAEVPDTKATITSNPSAVVLSLGRPPLSGQQNASDLYFMAVYDRAVNLAAALAAAGNLLEADELTGDR